MSEGDCDPIGVVPESERGPRLDSDWVLPSHYTMDLNDDSNCLRHKHYSVPSYFKTERTLDDEGWLNLLDDRPPPNQTRVYHQDYPSESKVCYMRRDFEPVKRMVCSLLWKSLEGLWKGFRQISDAANDNSAYFHMTIRLATTLICFLYNQETLFIFFDQPEWELTMQLNKLWEELVVLGKQARPLEEAYELVITLVTTNRFFCFVTETDVAQMLNCYRIQLEARDLLLCPTFTLPYKGNPFPEKEKDNLYDEIWDVIDKMESPRELMADSYTRLLIKVIKGEVDKKELIDIALKDIDTSAMDSLLDQDIPSPWTPRKLTQDEHKFGFEFLLADMISDLSSRLADKLMDALVPISQLFHPHDFYFVSNEVVGVIGVAEIRRIAVVLPPSIKQCDLVDRVMYDYHPPYHVHLSSARLAKSFGHIVRLENFLYAIFHTDDTDIDEPALEKREKYKAFVKDLLKSSTDSRDLERFHFLWELPLHPLPPFVVDDNCLTFSYN